MTDLLYLKSNDRSLAVPKLHDDGSNWADYEPWVCKAMDAKVIWRHVEGTAYKPKQYVIIGNMYILSDGITPATEKQIEAWESKVEEYKKKQYLAQHIILSMTCLYLGSMIKNIATAKEKCGKRWKCVTGICRYLVPWPIAMVPRLCKKTYSYSMHIYNTNWDSNI